MNNYLLVIMAAACLSVKVTAGCAADLPATPRLNVPRAERDVLIDGRIDEGEWRDGATIPRLVPPLGKVDAIKSPHDNATEVRVKWTPKYLYVLFVCWDEEIYSTEDMADEEDLFRQDVCEVFLDPVGDGRQYVELQCSPRGKRLDVLHCLSAPPVVTDKGILAYNFAARDHWLLREWTMADAQVAARREVAAGRWTVELALSAKTVLRRTGKAEFEPMSMRANFVRYDWPEPEAGEARELQQQNWSPLLLGHPHVSAARMGTLQLVANGRETIK